MDELNGELETPLDSLENFHDELYGRILMLDDMVR